MSEIVLTYESGFRTRAVHGSGAEITTAAAKEHGGSGDAFSPTDLLAASLGSCILSIIGIIGERKRIDIEGVRVTVTKELSKTLPAEIVRLATHVHLPKELEPADRQRLEKGATGCPVHHALRPEIEAPITFSYGSR